MAHSIHGKKRPKKKTAVCLLALLLLGALAAGGTIAYIMTTSQSVINIFTPTAVSCKVTEDFDGTVKKNVNVRNTSNIDAYIRVKLISYRVNGAGEHIGGVAEIPDFDPGDGWFKADGYYYYRYPIKAGASPNSPLIGESGITLIGDYGYVLDENYEVSSGDADGGRQVIEVMAEAINTGTDAVSEAWGLTVGTEANQLSPEVETSSEEVTQ